MTQMQSTRLVYNNLLTGQIYDGTWRTAHITQVVNSPATGEEIGHIGVANAEMIFGAATKARAAQRGWAHTSYDRRAEILRRAAQCAEIGREEIVDWLVRETGSTVLKANAEVAGAIKVLLEASAMPSQAAGQMLPTSPGRLSMARRRPIGVVGVISPFNFPLYLAIRAVAPAIAVGNSVILKSDPRTSISGGLIIARIFEEAGLPVGVFSVLPGDSHVGAALCEAPDVGMIQFTGSTAAGRKVGETAGRNLKKVSLELGGKNSLIVLDDADVDLAVKNTVWSTYLHQGQICMSAGRILVQEGIAESFTKRLTDHVAKLNVGDPAHDDVSLGPLINQHQVDRAAAIIKAAVEDGARIAVGGTYEKLFFSPTVLTDVMPGNPAYSEEIFAPVAVVTVFKSDEDAVNFANDTDYGLSAAIISRSVGRAITIGEKLNVGLLHINDSTFNDEVVNPFGGVGSSGNGSSIGGPANWEEFTQWQWMTVRAEAPPYPL